LVVEETDSPRGARRENWQPHRIEAMRLRWPNRNPRWRVRKLSTGSFANITQYVNGERTLNEDLVVWYGVHLRKRGSDNFECPPLGPDIYLSG
ncbi:MAG: hypothetical protein NZ556_01240, partial [Fimbriimonadales bacterium]|nr:hypothetical protein [Fimbriimonadales bacterium]